MLSWAALCGPDFWYCGFNRVGSYGDSTPCFSIADSPTALGNVVPSGAFDLFEAGLSRAWPLHSIVEVPLAGVSSFDVHGYGQPLEVPVHCGPVSSFDVPGYGSSFEVPVHCGPVFFF